MSAAAAAATHYAAIRALADAAARRAGRDPATVRIVGAAKRQPAARVAAAVREGLRDLGENYVQEAVATRQALAAELAPAEREALTWPGIGPVQTNKAREAIACFDWLHAVDALRTAAALARRAAQAGRAPAVLLQVNLSGESTKHGVGEAELAALVAGVRELAPLRLVGLMTMPAPDPDPEAARPVFARLRELAAQHDLAELSMGMSSDFEIAIEEGATLVRIGTALFGERS